jgi:2-oxoglutarate ferredoxin oxidoreductase subunit alpha
MSPFGGPHIVRFTTSSHDERGYLTKRADKVGQLNIHLSVKVEDYLNEIEMVKADLHQGADTLILSYGVSAQSVREAVSMARRGGINVSALTVYSLWPVPEQAILEALTGIKRVVVVELNLGQYRREIERIVKDDQEVIGVHRVDGELITPEEILERVGI